MRFRKVKTLRRSRGVALIMVLVAVAIMVMSAAVITVRFNRVFFVTRNALDYQRASWYVDGIEGIIRKYNLPAINGSSLRNSALGTSLNFEVLYDTNERLSIYAEGGASTLPPGWCGTEVFLRLFLKKLEAKDLLIPPLCSCIYSRSNSLKGFLYSLELETDRTLPRKQAIFKKRLPQPTADNPFGERVAKHITVPKEKLEVIENIIAEYRMRKWKDLPNRESIEGNTDFISIVFNYSDGNNICLDSDQELPPGYLDAFEAIHQALTEAEKAALEK